MLHVRLSVDAKCPRHPNRTYVDRPAGCGICQLIANTNELAQRADRELRDAGKLGAELRWRNQRRPHAAELSKNHRLEQVVNPC